MNAVSGAAGWIALHVFRGRAHWPCWLLDWAWSQQATPYVPQKEG